MLGLWARIPKVLLCQCLVLELVPRRTKVHIRSTYEIEALNMR